MKRFLLAICLLSMISACKKSDDAVQTIDAPGDEQSAPAIIDQPIQGKINGNPWMGASGIAQIVHQSDGTDQLKIQIATQKFSGCTLPSEFGWDGAVELWASLKTGTLIGSDASVMFHKGHANGDIWAYNHKVIRIDSIDTEKVVGAMAATNEDNDVSGNFTVKLCPF